MIKIGVCDDEEYQRSSIVQLCRQFAREKNIVCEVEQFCTGQEVLEYTGSPMTLLFLDIELGGNGEIDGLQVMKELEQSEQVWRFVFISSHQEKVFDAFGIKTLGFEVKPVCYAAMEKWIDTAVCENQGDVIVKFHKENNKFWYPLSSVVYLEAEGSYARVHTRSRDFCVCRNLKYWEERLPAERMVRSHKSYLVNLEYIDEIKEGIQIEGRKENIPIGRMYKKELKEKYHGNLEYFCEDGIFMVEILI